MGFRSSSNSRIVTAITTIVIVGILATGCAQSNSQKSTPPANSGPTRHLKFTVITNGQTSDPFWQVVKNGVDQAAKDMGVQAIYEAPNPFSADAMSQLIDAAVATQPDGLVVSIPDCAGLSPAISRVQLVDIPVISINSGSDCATKLGLLNHIGEDSYQAGLAGGQKLVAEGAKHVLCINPAVGDTDSDNRCRGVKDALTKAGGQSSVLAIDPTNPSQAQQKIQEQLTQGSSFDALIAVNPSSATIAMAALQQLGQAGQILLATFDVSSAVLQAIQQGTILFAIDQQPYLQGYLPIVLLTLYKTNLDSVTTPIINTGPVFVTKDNVAQVQQLSLEGTR
ncbi:MAG TPA: sugar ABC transporter substrate-binding protein [Ktedonobacterales bacterium]|nr:sugar ABC transporter substrate-binding protein [Ktedonobacterales bacterium]